MTFSLQLYNLKCSAILLQKKKNILKEKSYVSLRIKIVNVSKGKMCVSYFHIFLNIYRRKQLYDDGWCLLDTVFISSYRLLHRNVQVSYCNIYLVV